MEIWKEIKGYEGLYEISNFGRVKALKRKGIPQDIIKATPLSSYGYNKVTLQYEGKIKVFLIHRLVAIHFVDNPNNYAVVNHLDGDKLNNRASNLEWCTKSENTLHAMELGLLTFKKGNEHYNTKIKDEEIPKIFEYKKSGMKNYEIAKLYGVNPATISKILRKQRRKNLL